MGEVTLKDFKELIQITKSDKNSWKNFNFFFKSMDPELGTVKQEVCKTFILKKKIFFCFKTIF